MFIVVRESVSRKSAAGSLDIAAKAMEVDLAKAGLHMLVEKPISMRPAEEVERLAQVSCTCIATA